MTTDKQAREEALIEAARAAIARVEKTMCPTYSSDAGDLGMQGRISQADLDIIQIAALRTPAESETESQPGTAAYALAVDAEMTDPTPRPGETR